MQTVQEALEEVAEAAADLVAYNPRKDQDALRGALWRLKLARAFPVRDKKEADQ